MKNLFPKTLVFLLLALLSLALLTTAIGEDAPPADQIASDPSNSYVQWTNTERSTGLAITYIDIGITPGTGSLFVSATTEANMTADIVGGYVRIQQWKDSKWTTVKTIGFDRYGTTSSSLNRSVNVTGGYYYRVLGVHDAVLDMDSVSKSTSTGSVYVN